MQSKVKLKPPSGKPMGMIRLGSKSRRDISNKQDYNAKTKQKEKEAGRGRK